MLHQMSELYAPTAFGHLHLSKALERFESHVYVGIAFALVFEVHTLGLAGFHRQGLPHVGEHLVWLLVEADHRSFGIVGIVGIVRLFVEIQNLLHPPHKSGTLSGRDHPLLLQVRLEAVFLSVRRTVS
jgi:hypothetical protein